MEVLTQWRAGTDLIDVWVRQAGSRGAQIAHVGTDGLLTFEEVELGSREVQPTFTLRTDVWAALSAKAAGVLPPSAATERHLEDVVGVRDRLLALVERGVGGG